MLKLLFALALLPVALKPFPYSQGAAIESAEKIRQLRGYIYPENTDCGQGVCVEWICPSAPQVKLLVGPTATEVEYTENGIVIFDAQSDGTVTSVGIDPAYVSASTDLSLFPRTIGIYVARYRRSIDTIYACAQAQK